MEFDWSVVGEAMPALLSGARLTILITLAGLVGGLIVGFVTGLMRAYGNKLLNAIAFVYIELIRGTPIVVQVMFIYFALPVLADVRVNPMTAAVTAIVVNAGAYIAEIVRGSFLSVHKGLKEAGLALGLPMWKVLVYIIGPVAFLSEPSTALATLAVIGIWQLLGFNMILFLAGLTAIPRDLYEAADIDGCSSGIDRFLTITWPLLGPTTMFVLVTTMITAFKIFDTVAVMTRGGPIGSTEVLLYNIYLEGFQYFHTGYAAALTFIFLAFILVFSAVQTFALDRKVHY